MTMVRKRGFSNTSSTSSLPEGNQELESMYDYLAKVILLGPSGAGKSCVLHRFVKNEWRVLSSQTIGVEFSSRIVKLGIGPRRTRIKLQLWDTAGTERFRSVSRSYYRGAAGAILIYDVSSHTSFASLPTFLMDARALASPNLTVLLAGNKMDLSSDISLHGDSTEDATRPPPTPSSTSSKQSAFAFGSVGGSVRSTNHLATGTRMTATYAPHGREVCFEESSRWAAKSNIPVAVEVSALTGEGVEELFNRLARIILTKIELGEIDPDDPQSGIQYGDGGLYGHGTSDGSSIRSRMTLDDSAVQLHNRNPRSASRWKTGMREWEDVFRLSGPHDKNGEGCC
ncbi:P-loop containing nucleoside triphosphate hydrolase protein [Aspergillus caelatus]|uniref:P-loop containing nucleoside triphosphate hydrolase protein n=1 Tax=Aspergillus caelatus TaxID=61420 RepID=A0A5N7A1T8_9EURO|nr:P-loop containing nucleoside triphosphate hydrolase protein [Aspergillus caelatus]KAE8363645.1 P-loop containing nucleoside triphosphate hydrolase protein [Aspergillus caelatus]